MTSPETLSALFAAIFAHIREKLAGQVDFDEIDRRARSVLDQMRVEDGPIDWESAEPLTVGSVRWAANVGRGVRLIGHISELHDPALTVIPNSDGGPVSVETVAARLVGIDGEQLQMLNVIGRSLIEHLQEARRSGRVIELLGLVVALPIDIKVKRPDQASIVGNFFLHLVDVRLSTSAFDLLGATQTERDSARALLHRLRTTGRAPLAYLRSEVLTNLGVVGLENAPHIAEGIEFVVLQAVSRGTMGNGSARLHGLSVGPPGVGKTLVGQAARALNPVAREASAAKISLAGLVGASHRTDVGWTSTPGLLPQAADGVLVVQDAHAWSGPDLRRLAPTLQEVMEDGEVRDAVAGGRKRLAPTALYIDLNRLSQVRAGRAMRGAPEAALLATLPLLSRFDSIHEAAVNPDAAWVLGEKMYPGLRQGLGSLDDQVWIRRARMLVALLRDEHPEIDTTGVIAQMQTVHRDLHETFRELDVVNPIDASAIPVRLVRSMTKLVIASARASDRRIAAREDVDRAKAIVTKKLQFMARASSIHTAPPQESRQGERDAYYRGRWAGQDVRPGDVAQDYVETTGEPVTEKTVRRDFERLGARKAGGGLWRLPAAGR